uniref:Hypothetical secreted peptide n=1 Tax=Rhipicephalus sanguineus TaxID=34632 RepID=C9W1N2_RHISA
MARLLLRWHLLMAWLRGHKRTFVPPLCLGLILCAVNIARSMGELREKCPADASPTPQRCHCSRNFTHENSNVGFWLGRTLHCGMLRRFP